ncbi:prepilin-type N-terminal cleavage/methylation domain-containing protein [Paenibacillus ihumii]|uniref:prepilin-type N-terminal cleavage/methylation domain-containing protein n=1 Tax=Paenibacillus ihumii TaxID=687436 RepID=UPI0006D82ABD|nr:prepilin-type N-terminal cleavage/methylation domain-containing protein [Paenibacillus ihumii]
MLQRTVRTVKNEKGLTLIELLAVVVILGIIALIAIPAIGGLIDNSKKDAHVANAIQMINSAKLAVVGDDTYRPDSTKLSKEITLALLQSEGYLEPVRDPDGQTYTADSKVTISTTDGGKTLKYAVTLKNQKRQINNINEEDLKRSSVTDLASPGGGGGTP